MGANFFIKDKFHSHPKTLELVYEKGGAIAISLWVIAGSWSLDLRTNGEVNGVFLKMFMNMVGATKETVDLLVKHEWWERTADGVRFVDWEKHVAPTSISASGSRTRRIYFAEARGLGLIKIGSAINPQVRMSELQTGCPAQIDIIAVMKGTFGQERDLHKRFRHLQTTGEWFRAEPDLLAFIDEIKGGSK